MIPLGLEPKTHSLEGCCSIQLSYGTSSSVDDFAGAKVHIFLETAKFSVSKSDFKSYVGAVIEGIIPFGEGFSRLEDADIERVVEALGCQPFL